MALLVIRISFFLVLIGLAVSIVQSNMLPPEATWAPWAVFIGMAILPTIVIALDAIATRKRLDVISSVYFGVVVGLFLTYAVSLAIAPLPISNFIRPTVNVVIGIIMCYVCISLLIQTRDDFRFIIPYVEFSKEVKGVKPFVLDTSVVIDGRIADVVDTKVLDSPLIMPRFVLAELQSIADSSDKLRRSRGRRGLDILNRLRSNNDVDFQIFEHDLPEFAGHPVDLKLVLLAKHVEGKIVTNDYNLNKVARLHGVDVINLNELANALKPQFLPGEQLDLRLVKQGEEPGQGIGYLDDGTMVVVEGGREHLQQNVRVTVTSVLQTSAGRMIFGRCERLAG